jgi:enoyl-CoA hydratase/carnithine racemase
VSGALVEVERDGAIAVIVLQRPEARNAMNVALAAATCDAMRDCQDARAIVLTGADPAFCAGLDLRNLGTDHLIDLPPFVASVSESAVPVVAAVNGPAVTGGFELALACDFIVASERAAFADTHLRVGVYPGPVLVELPRRVGMAWAREMSLTGNFVDAETAGRIGIANHVVPHDALLPFARELAHAIAEQDPAMVSRMREDWDATGELPVAEAHRVHGEFGRDAMSPSHDQHDLAAHHDAVIERSRAQRGGAD